MLDRTRLAVEKRLGTDPVDPNTTFEEGDLLQYSANGWAVSADATAEAIRGIAGLTKASVLYAAIIDEAVTLPAEDDVNLAHANIVDGSQKVTDETGDTTYEETTDYLFNDTNGIISRVATGSIEDGETVLVSYTYQRTEQEIEEEIGKGIRNDSDETFGTGNVVVLQGNMTIATTRYDTSQAYVVNDVLYDNGDGLLTSTDGGSYVAVGHVKTPPTAADLFLIAELNL
jgi:hypothetical protein